MLKILDTNLRGKLWQVDRKTSQRTAFSNLGDGKKNGSVNMTKEGSIYFQKD